MVCDRCGAQAAAGDSFCRRCGLQLTAPEPPPPPAWHERPTVQLPAVPEAPLPDRGPPAYREATAYHEPAAYRGTGPARNDLPTDRPARRPSGDKAYRDRRAERRRRALVSAGAIVVVLGVVWALVFVVNGHHRDDTAAPAPTSGRLNLSSTATTKSSVPSSTPSTTSAPPSTRATTSASTAARQAQAKAIRGLAGRSGEARASIGRALSEVNSCTHVDDAVSRLDGAAVLRRKLNSTLATIPVTGLPGGTALRSSLSQALLQSAAADTDYAAWARANLSCRKKPKRTQDFVNAEGHDKQATAAKQDFVNRWNPIAAGSGQPKLSPSSI